MLHFLLTDASLRVESTSNDQTPTNLLFLMVARSTLSFR